MVWLANGENILKIHLFVLTEFMNVTDGWTDGHHVMAYATLMHSIMQQNVRIFNK